MQIRPADRPFRLFKLSSIPLHSFLASKCLGKCLPISLPQDLKSALYNSEVDADAEVVCRAKADADPIVCAEVERRQPQVVCAAPVSEQRSLPSEKVHHTVLNRLPPVAAESGSRRCPAPGRSQDQANDVRPAARENRSMKYALIVIE
jgi:hypothetical protein